MNLKLKFFLIKQKIKRVYDGMRYFKFNFLHGVKVYNKPKWFQKLWFKYIWNGNEFHPLLETNIFKSARKGESVDEFMKKEGIHLVKNRNLAKRLYDEPIEQ